MQNDLWVARGGLKEMGGAEKSSEANSKYLTMLSRKVH